MISTEIKVFFEIHVHVFVKKKKKKKKNVRGCLEFKPFRCVNKFVDSMKNSFVVQVG